MNYPFGITSNNKVLVIGAHPDDYEIGCGGTIKVLKGLGYEIYGLILTDGGNAGKKTERIKESKASAKVLGINKVFFAHLEDGKLSDDVEHVRLIEKYIKSIRPSIVITSSTNDTHQDHRNCAYATFSATRVHRYNIDMVLIYELNSTKPFDPHYFVDISNTFNDKIKALKKHKSQIERKCISLDKIELRARFRGSQVGVNYAEAFEINHILLK